MHEGEHKGGIQYRSNILVFWGGGIHISMIDLSCTYYRKDEIKLPYLK